MIKLGLIGYPLGHSFSKNYYLNKFEQEDITGIDYDLYPLKTMDEFKALYASDLDFKGVNVTIPHKQEVISLLSELSDEAKEIGAVNCITINRDVENKVTLKGHNTDAYGFEQSFAPLLRSNHKKALVLGNGGAAKAVVYILKKLNIPFLIVSRSIDNGDITYQDITAETISEHQIIINCSPVGTFPNIELKPDLPYQFLTSDHYLYDLIYNPEQTAFLKEGHQVGAITKNGYDMLVFQAEKNWDIWKQNF